MASSLNKVRSGDPLQIPAESYNAIVDGVRNDIASRFDGGDTTSRGRSNDSNIVVIKNNSDDNQERFNILGIDGPIRPPEDNLNEFKNRIVLQGDLPNQAAHSGKFVILAEGIPKHKLGLARVAGVSPVRLFISEDTQGSTQADVQSGISAYLKGGSGAAQILWKESGTGTRWAIIRFGGVGGGGGGSTFAVVRETYPSPSKVLLAQEVQVGADGVLDLSGDPVTIRVWPGLLSENYAALRWVGDLQPSTIIISVSQMGGQSYAEQWSGLRYRLLKRPRNVRVTDCLPVEVQF